MAKSVAVVAVSTVRPIASRSSGSLTSCLTPAAPPDATSPSSGARRKRRKSEAKRALTMVAAGDNIDRRGTASAPLPGGDTNRVRHVDTDEHRLLERVD